MRNKKRHELLDLATGSGEWCKPVTIIGIWAFAALMCGLIQSAIPVVIAGLVTLIIIDDL